MMHHKQPLYLAVAAIMLAERCCRAYMRALIWLVLYILFLWVIADLIPAQILPRILPIVALGFYGGLGVFIWRGTHFIKIPTSLEIDRRIERANALSHRPLAFLKDRPVDIGDDPDHPDDKIKRDLWARQQKAARAQLRGLHPPWPEIGWVGLDRYALRCGVLLALVLAGGIAGEEWKSRLMAGFLPNPVRILYPAQAPVQLTIIPPDYTGLDQTRFLALPARDKTKDRISIPDGSRLKLSIHSHLGTPSLHIGSSRLTAQKQAENLYYFEGILNGPDLDFGPKGKETDFTIKVTQFGFPRASWAGRFVPDQPPQLNLRQDVQITELQALRIPLTFRDDYGVHRLDFMMKASRDIGIAPLGRAITQSRAIAAYAGEGEIQPLYDLTDHPWAGLPVEISMRAVDQKDQTSPDLVIPMILPERIFHHPLARNLIKYRKELAWTPEISAANIALRLEGDLIRPNVTEGDMSLYHSLKNIAQKLRDFDESATEGTAKEREQIILGVMDLLWDAALRLEDGNLSVSRRALERSYQDLSSALQDPEKPPVQSYDKLDPLAKNFSRYIRELGRELRKGQADRAGITDLSPQILDKILSDSAIQRFMEDLGDEITANHRAEALNRLSELKQLMDVLDPSLANPLPRQITGLSAGVNELQELIENLRDLKFETQKIEKTYERFSPFILRNVPSIPSDPPFLQPPPDYKSNHNPDRKSSYPENLADNILPDFPPLPRALHNDPIAEYPDESKRPGLYHGKAQEQLSLRYVLGHLMKETGEYYGEIPDNMGQAELIIREVEGRLRNHNARQAVPRQQAAIDKLREAQQDLAKKLRDMIEERARRTGTSPGGDLFGGHPPGGGSNLDPFGRPQSPDGLPNNQGQEDGGHVGGGLYDPFIEIPENGEQKFIQDILKELRDRAGQAQRPESERDYIRRLLEQFQF